MHATKVSSCVNPLMYKDGAWGVLQLLNNTLYEDIGIILVAPPSLNDVFGLLTFGLAITIFFPFYFLLPPQFQCVTLQMFKVTF